MEWKDMSLINLIEKLANNTHHHQENHSLINSQSPEIKEAFLTNDAELLKKQVSDTEYFANSIKVVQLESV